MWRVGAAGYSLLFSAFIGEGRFLRKEGLIPNILNTSIISTVQLELCSGLYMSITRSIHIMLPAEYSLYYMHIIL